MKKPLAFLLAVLMVASFLPILGVTAAAEPIAAEPTTTYAIYTQNFEGVGTTLDTRALWTNLGWYVPTGKEDSGMAEYSIIGTDNHALRVDTTRYPVGLEQDSFLTVFGGEVMSVLREGDFSLSYDITYREGTTNADGYAALLYNYNGKSGSIVGDETGEAYGLVAVRPNGTGTSSLYYPIHSACAFTTLEDRMNAAENVLSNRYTANGPYPSLYARLYGAEENDTTVRAGSLDMVDKTVTVRIAYSYENGVSVYADAHDGRGEILVSEPCTKSYDSVNNPYTWQNFLSRNDGGAIAIAVKPGIVADIDNISITSSTYGGAHKDEELPELLITEMSGTGPATSSNNYYWAEYIEIYNPTDHEVDLCDYSLMYAEYTEEAGVNGSVATTGTNVKFNAYMKFSDLLGKKAQSLTAFYELQTTLDTMTDGVDFTYVDGDRYNGSKVKDTAGLYRKIYYIESWNTRYTQGATQAASSTRLQPGEVAVLYIMEDARQICWQYGVNARQNNTTSFSSATSFRQVCSSYGLTATTKVFGVATHVTNKTKFSMYDSKNRYYYIGKAYDETKTEIDYRKLNITDLPYVVSYAQYSTPMISGVRYDGTDPDNSNIGRAGISEKNTCAHYVYGLDASSDYRRGLMYNGHGLVTSDKSIGQLMGYQQVIFENIAHRRNGAMSPLSITEIVPRTNDLAGNDINAFSAMELTNTTTNAINLYDYALVRTPLDNACKYLAPNNPVKNQFNRINYLQAGNPITRGSGNGAYYYFMEDHIVNPDTCVLQPGETVVLWFLTTDTYTAYGGDEDFGFDYFRQYWVDNGCGQLGEKTASGAYATKVIAVDAHEGTTFNADNADRVFEISSTGSAVYGIVQRSSIPENFSIEPSTVLSIAVVTPVSLYFNITPQWLTSLDGTRYWANVMTYAKIPANKSIRYVAGLGQETGACKMTDSVKVGYYSYNSSLPVKLKESEISKGLNLTYATSKPLKTPDLGRLAGREYFAVNEREVFLKTTDESGNITYYYYDTVRITGVQTLSGAALSTTGEAALRFDTIIPTSYYNTLAATYGGGNIRTGALVVRADQADRARALAKNGVTLTTVQSVLNNESISNRAVDAVTITRSNGFAVLGASYTVGASDFGTAYTAIGFLEVTLPNGTIRTIWSGTAATAGVKEVAAKALADVSSSQTETYRYQRTGAAGKYSPYPTFMQEVLSAYSGS